MKRFLTKLEASPNASGQTSTKVKTASAADNTNDTLPRHMCLLRTLCRLPIAAHLLRLHMLPCACHCLQRSLDIPEAIAST